MDERLLSRGEIIYRRTRRRVMRWAHTIGALILTLPASFVVLPAGLRLENPTPGQMLALLAILALAALFGILLARLVAGVYLRTYHPPPP